MFDNTGNGTLPSGSSLFQVPLFDLILKNGGLISSVLRTEILHLGTGERVSPERTKMPHAGRGFRQEDTNPPFVN